MQVNKKKEKIMNIETREYKIKLMTPMLGTVPKSKEVYAKYIAGLHEDEVETVEEVEEGGWTGFHKDDNGLFIYDYMVKGTVKNALGAMIENGAIKKIVAYKKWCDELLHVYPRRLYFGVTEPDGVMERPLRAMTAKGPRVSLARSDMMNEGREISFRISLFKNNKGLDFNAIETALGFGQFCGLGQWRGSGGYGRFEVVTEV